MDTNCSRVTDVCRCSTGFITASMSFMADGGMTVASCSNVTSPRCCIMPHMMSFFRSRRLRALPLAFTRRSTFFFARSTIEEASIGPDGGMPLPGLSFGKYLRRFGYSRTYRGIGGRICRICRDGRQYINRYLNGYRLFLEWLFFHDKTLFGYKLRHKVNANGMRLEVLNPV